MTQAESFRADIPLRLDENRISYLIPGGDMIDRFYGRSPTPGGMASQEWIASVVTSALTKGMDGLSRLSRQNGGQYLKDVLQSHAPEMLGRAHMARYGTNPGFLLKLLHSDSRLLVQTHPDDEKATRYFHQSYGKTEAWYVLDVNPGRQAVIYAGFKQTVTPKNFRSLILRQDTAAILDCLHSFAIAPGDAIFIPPGTPHALGADCLIAEIQQPSDITLRAERFCPDGRELPPESLDSGIGLDGLMDCFQFPGDTRENTQRRLFVRPCLRQTADGEIRVFFQGESPGFFSMREISVFAGRVMPLQKTSLSVVLVLEGDGSITTNGGMQSLRKGDKLVLPYALQTYSCWAERKLTLLECGSSAVNGAHV